MNYDRQLGRFRLEVLEDRLNFALVTNTMDYDRPYDPLNQATEPIMGSLRHELQAAMKHYDDFGVPDTITFDTKLAGQTIELKYGSLDIYHPVVITAPKTQFPTANYDFVTIQWTHWSAANDPMNPTGNYGSDWSVLQINIPASEPTVAENYAKGVSLAGLIITGGRGVQGGGMQVSGIITLNINQCEISGNTLNRFNDDGVTAGGGIWTNGAEFGINRRTYGPRVNISNSKIHGNATDINDNKPNPGPDFGGGIYLGYGSSLRVVNSTMSKNAADNGGGAIYMEGGAFYEDPTAIKAKPIFTTELQIHNSQFVENEITSYSASGPGGAISINNTIAGMIADTTFNLNQAKSHGGAIHITGPGVESPTKLWPYSELIGEVNIVACTFENNLAAQIGKDNNGDDVIRDSGSGGAINADGVHNRVYLVNSTLGGNSTVIGKGGAVAVQPSKVYYDHVMLFEKDLNARVLMLSKDQGDQIPGPYLGKTRFQIDNTTIAYNQAKGQFKFDSELGKNILHGARGGGLAVVLNSLNQLAGEVLVTSTIVAENTVFAGGFGPDLWAADDGSAFAISLPGIGDNGLGFNLVGTSNSVAGGKNDAGCLSLSCSIPPGTLTAKLDPQLDALDYYGGATKNYRLLSTSPAIDRGANVLNLGFDQRGFPNCREVEYNLSDQQFEPRADVGAFELQTRMPTIISVTTNNQPQQSMVTSIFVQFSEPISMPNGVNAAILLERIGPDVPTGWVNLVGAINGPVVTLTFATGGTVGIDKAGSLLDGIYKLTIVGANVVGALGKFDGNCDGVGGDNWEIIGNQDNGLFRLFGDINGDGQVTAYDFNEFRLAYGSTSGQSSYHFAFDWDGDGLIGALDFNQFRLRYGFDMFSP